MYSTSIRSKITFSLDPVSGVPFYRQIIQQVERAILAKHLVPGDRLPTIRSLAIELKINPNTIAKAYSELELRGLVITQVGSGTYISDKEVDLKETERQKRIEECIGRFFKEMEALGIRTKQDLIELIQQFKEE
ncbi:GntR family transcriptional regulator [Gracilinema caldarium]|uniref:Transcriptional regulator, GntR family n=1 Tax=Gracilinema caldarium (strain ATCC 51460 / DSM 7334 / H1) TaxID=744872 RepID=F8F284_GRAC1|nr:GntR family transcriptional regulator [Gracilinema caldarium]AEJ20356.1 transcriptional regulator, GntR family [Gracilinema caldarium DSM 7334]